MPTYQDLKSVKYIEQAIQFAEKLLGIKFKGTKGNNFSAYCPFHDDKKDSFRVYVNDKGEVRFHCFGECQVDWDIYDVIMTRTKCSFKQAQYMFAHYLRIRIKDFHTYGKPVSYKPIAEDLKEPDEPVGFVEPKQLDPKVAEVLNEAAVFYSQLLLDNPERFKKIHNYLQRRGVTEDTIWKFNIGYDPPFKDEDCAGRALIKRYLNRFKNDYTEFYHFRKGGLVRLLNDASVKGHGYYRQFIDFSREFQETWGAYGAYADYFAGRITFPIYNIKGQAHGFMGSAEARTKRIGGALALCRKISILTDGTAQKLS